MLNTNKIKFIRFKHYTLINGQHLTVPVYGVSIKESESVKYLILNFSSYLQSGRHIGISTNLEGSLFMYQEINL